MVIRVIIVAILSGILIGCGVLKNKNFEIIGIAQEDKDAAIVVTEDKQIYLLDGVEHWDEAYRYKKVKVTGRLHIEMRKKESTDSIWVQERVGERLIIKHPKWSLVQ
jgi:hypothetical protein